MSEHKSTRKNFKPIDDVNVTHLKPNRPPLDNISRSLSEIEEWFAVFGKPEALPGWKVRIGLDKHGDLTSLLVGRLSDEPHVEEGESGERTETVTMLNWPLGESHEAIATSVPLVTRRLTDIPLTPLLDGEPGYKFRGGRELIRERWSAEADPHLWGEPLPPDVVIREAPKGGMKPLTDLQLALDAQAYVHHKEEGGTIKTFAEQQGYSHGNGKRRITLARDRGFLPAVKDNQQSAKPYLTSRAKTVLREAGHDVD